MAKPFEILEAQMPPEDRAKAKEKSDTILYQMALNELREARKLSQEDIATTLNVKQAAISKMERRTDMYISTLRRFVGSLGGELEIIVRFPDGIVKISQFSELDKPTP